MSTLTHACRTIRLAKPAAFSRVGVEMESLSSGRSQSKPRRQGDAKKTNEGLDTLLASCQGRLPNQTHAV